MSRVPRWRLRLWWEGVRPVAILIAAAVTLVLGAWGFARTPATAGGDFFDDLYRSFHLFGSSGGEVDPPVAWRLAIARVFAPLIVGYAALRGLASLFREQWVLLRLRLRFRHHVLIAGLGRTGSLLARALHEARIKTVVIERDPASPGLASLRRRGIPVVIGNAGDPEVLAAARCGRATHVVACCGRDATNLDVLAAATTLAGRPAWLPTTAHIVLGTQPLWRAMRANAVAGEVRPGLRVEFVSLPDRAADAVVRDQLRVSHPPPPPGSKVVVSAGTGTMGCDEEEPPACKEALASRRTQNR